MAAPRPAGWPCARLQAPSGWDGSSDWGAEGRGVSGGRLQQRPRPPARGIQRGTRWVLLSNWWRQGGPEGAVGPPAQDGGSQTSWLGGGAGSSLAGGRLVVCFLTETASRNQREGTRRPDRHRALQRAPPALPAGLCPALHLLLQPGTSFRSPLWTCHSQLTEEFTYAPRTGQPASIHLRSPFSSLQEVPEPPLPS